MKQSSRVELWGQTENWRMKGRGKKDKIIKEKAKFTQSKKK